jgi:hypothetical protein
LIRKGDAHSGLIRAFTLIGHEIPDAARGGYFRIEAHQYSGSVLGNLLNKELLPPRHDAECFHAANMAARLRCAMRGSSAKRGCS